MSLASLLVLVLVFLAGNGLLRLLRFRSSTGPERLGFAFAAGCVILAAAATLLSPLGLATAAPLILTLLAVAVLPVFLQRPVAVELRQEWPSFLPTLAVVVLSFWLASQRPVWNVDAQMRWVLHGQWMAAEGTLTPERMEDPSWAENHPAYPPLVPALTGLAVQLGASPDAGVRGLFPAFFLALLGMLHGFGVRALGPLRGWLLPLAFGLTPAFAWMSSSGMAFGLGADAAVADVPLALMLTGLSMLLLDAFRRAERAQFMAMTLLAAGACWTKQEGAAFVLVMLLATLSCSALIARGEARLRALRGLAVVLTGALAAAGLWRLVAASMPVAPGEDYLSAGGLAALFGNLGRLPAVLGGIGAELVRFAVWGPLWLVALAASAVAIARRDAVGLLPLLWLLLGIGVAAAGFLASGWRDGDYPRLMDVSLTRLLIHHAPLAALMVAELGRRTLPRRAAAGRA